MQNNKKLLGVRVSPNLHKIIKQAALDNDVTIQDYVIGLIMADIQIRQGKSKSDFGNESNTGRG